MGYSKTKEPRNIEFGGGYIGGGYPVINTVAGDISPFSFQLPNYVGRVEFAYMDIYLDVVNNTSAGDNWNDGAQYIRISDGTWHNAILIPDASIFVPTGKTYLGRLIGNIDVSEYCNNVGPLGWMAWQWRLAKAHANTLQFEGTIYAILKMCIV